MKTIALRLAALPLSLILAVTLGACQGQSQDSATAAATEAVTGDGVAMEPRDQISVGPIATEEPEAAETPATGDSSDEGGERIHVTQLSVEDCFNMTTSDSETSVSYVTLVDCMQPHGNEVYAEKTLTQSTIPSTEELEAEAEEFCAGSSFSDYVGAELGTSMFAATYFIPTADSWAIGDRLITCILFPADNGETAGSAKGSGQ